MRIMFTSAPTRSHIAPMLPLVDSAVRAGHEVVFVTGADGVALAARPGVTVVRCGPTWAEGVAWYRALLTDSSVRPAGADASLTHMVANLFVRHLGHEMGLELIPIVAELQPAVVISELAEFGGRVAANHAGIPHVTHGFGPQQPVQFTAEADRAVLALHAPFGIPTDLTERWRDEWYLDIWPIDTPADTVGRFFEHVMPLRPAAVVPPLPPAPMLSALPRRPTVYVTLGSMYNASPEGTAMLERLIAMFDHQPMNAVVTAGHGVDVSRFATTGDAVVVREFVPQDAVIPYVDAVLSHGGAGTSLGALTHGTPHVMIPLASDHHRIAASVAQAGAGIALGPGASPQEVGAALQQVQAEPRFRAAAERVSESLRGMPGADEVLQRIVDTV